MALMLMKLGGQFLRTGITGRNGQPAFGLDQSCCECLPCCGNCPDLAGYQGDLCVCLTGAVTGCQLLTRDIFGGTPPECESWTNPGNFNPNEPDPCADFFVALDIRLVCKFGQLPRLIIGHPDDATCNLDERETELAADTLNCTLGNFEFVRTVAILGGSCLCSPASITFTITKAPCP